MAAYDYYNQSGRHPAMPPGDGHGPPSPGPFTRLPATQGYTGASVSPGAPAIPDHDPYYARYSQNSLASDNGPYAVGGKRDDGTQYAENIPLQHPDARPDWMQQPTDYAPSTEAQQNTDPSTGRGGRRRGKGFFQKKIAWVTYTLTAAQVVVFIVELVKSGKAITARCWGLG